MAETLYAIPSSFAAGTTVSYLRTLSDYPATAGWTLNLYINSLNSVATTTAVASGDSHVVTLSATATGALTAGDYTYSETVTLGALVYEVARGTVKVTPKLASAAAGAIQTNNEKLLALVETALSGRITADVESYTIGGRSISKIPFRDLMKIRGQLKAAVWAERNPGGTYGSVDVVFSEGA